MPDNQSSIATPKTATSATVTAPAPQATATKTAAKTSPGTEAVPYEARKMQFSRWEKAKWLGQFYWQFKYILTVLLTLTVAHAVTILVQPIMFRNIFDVLTGGFAALSKHDDMLTVWLIGMGYDTTSELAWVFMAFAGLAFIVYVLLQNHRAWMNCRLEMAFRQKVFDDITSYGPRFYNNFNLGDLVTRLTDDVAEKLSWFACSGIFRFYEAIILLVVGLSVMLSLNATLTLWTMAPLPILIGLFRYASARLDRRYDILQSRISRVSDVMEACFSGIRVVKAYGKENAQLGRFAQAVAARSSAEIDAVKAQTVVDSFYMYVWEFGIVLALVAGGYMVVHDQITLGEYLAFDFFVAMMIMPMLDIGQFLVKGLQSAVSIDRLMELQSWRATRTLGGDAPISAVAKEVRFADVRLSLDGKRKALDGVSLVIPAGATAALVGKVGSGKTWTINLLPRLIDPDQGEITIDGAPLKSFDIDALRRMIGFVSQEPILFSDTVENNIRFGREYVSDADVAWALEASQLAPEVAKLPHGAASTIGNRGVQLSGGQKQRLSLARALAGKPRLLILDDCASALDAHTEELLWRSLKEVSADITTIVVTHRTSTLKNADVIFVFEHGKVVESGNHAELIRSGNLYKEIYHRHELEEAV